MTGLDYTPKEDQVVQFLRLATVSTDALHHRVFAANGPGFVMLHCGRKTQAQRLVASTTAKGLQFPRCTGCWKGV